MSRCDSCLRQLAWLEGPICDRCLDEDELVKPGADKYGVFRGRGDGGSWTAPSLDWEPKALPATVRSRLVVNLETREVRG